MKQRKRKKSQGVWRRKAYWLPFKYNRKRKRTVHGRVRG